MCLTWLLGPVTCMGLSPLVVFSDFFTVSSQFGPFLDAKHEQVEVRENWGALGSPSLLHPTVRGLGRAV